MPSLWHSCLTSSAIKVNGSTNTVVEPGVQLDNLADCDPLKFSYSWQGGGGGVFMSSLTEETNMKCVHERNPVDEKKQNMNDGAKSKWQIGRCAPTSRPLCLSLAMILRLL